MSNYLSREKQAAIIGLLCEGSGIRPLERALDVHRDTIMRLGVEVGEGYCVLHDRLVGNLNPARLELDEAWSFVHTKQAKLEPGDPKDYGDQYSFVAMDSDTKLITAYHVGKRTKANTIGFALDLASRMKLGHSPQITSDGFDSYKDAIALAFGPDVDYAMLIKEYKAACSVEASVRYASAEVEKVKKIVVSGEPDEDAINTAFVERQNLTLRMLTRRFNRLTNAHSKTLRNHRAAFDLYVGYYNFCWEHSSLRNKTPAMAAGIARERWDTARLVAECRHLAESQPPERPGSVQYARYLERRQQARKR